MPWFDFHNTFFSCFLQDCDAFGTCHRLTVFPDVGTPFRRKINGCGMIHPVPLSHIGVFFPEPDVLLGGCVGMLYPLAFPIGGWKQAGWETGGRAPVSRLLVLVERPDLPIISLIGKVLFPFGLLLIYWIIFFNTYCSFRLIMYVYGVLENDGQLIMSGEWWIPLVKGEWKLIQTLY